MNPYTIRLFMPNGNPDSFKIVDKMNWTGVGLEISRDSWVEHKNRAELDQAGIYILFGYEDASDLPTVYIGQGDGIRKRIDSHYKTKDFWDRALVFVSTNNGLNRAHITWIEWALITKAIDMKRCSVDNSVVPNEPVLSEYEKADTKEFLNEILSILPILDIKVFEESKKILVENRINDNSYNKATKDTIVIPAQEEGFRNVFLGENSWYAIRISAGKLNQIKYIAAYQTSPISAVTHYAEVESIEPYGDTGKYKVNFQSKATKLDTPIVFGSATKGTLQGMAYTSFDKIKSSKEVKELF